MPIGLILAKSFTSTTISETFDIMLLNKHRPVVSISSYCAIAPCHIILCSSVWRSDVFVHLMTVLFSRKFDIGGNPVSSSMPASTLQQHTQRICIFNIAIKPCICRKCLFVKKIIFLHFCWTLIFNLFIYIWIKG